MTRRPETPVALRLETDPFAFARERPPATAARVYRSRHQWRDAARLRRLYCDDADFGGSGDQHPAAMDTEPVHAHGLPQSLSLVLPPLAALVLEQSIDG